VLLWPVLLAANSLCLDASGRGVWTATARRENASQIIEAPRRPSLTAVRKIAPLSLSYAGSALRPERRPLLRVVNLDAAQSIGGAARPAPARQPRPFRQKARHGPLLFRVFASVGDDGRVCPPVKTGASRQRRSPKRRRPAVEAPAAWGTGWPPNQQQIGRNI